MKGTLKDFTELVKEHIPEGQKVSLWEQFLTGTSQQYQTLTQQAQDVYAYDISQAYANYKRQQLQLQMNQQLGEGFKQQVGSQLHSQYGSAFSDIKTQEETALGKIGEQHREAIAAGEEEFTKLGQTAKTFNTLLSEFEQEVISQPAKGFAKIFNVKTGLTKPTEEEMYKEYQNEDGEIVRELTDKGRLYYYELLTAKTKDNDLTFDKWLLSDETASTLDLEDREAFLESYLENPEIYKQAVGGIGGWTAQTAQEMREKIKTDERNAVLAEVTPVFETMSKEFKELYGDYSQLSNEQLRQLSKHAQRNKNYVTYINTDKAIGFSGKTITDKYGAKWTTKSVNLTYSSGTGVGSKDSEAKRLAKKLGILDSKERIKNSDKYRAGDVIYVDGQYWLIMEQETDVLSVRKLEKGMSTKDLLKQGVE